MVKLKPKKEEETLEFKLSQKLNNFNPSEVESYLEVLLKKCLVAAANKDYLTLGNVEELLNKSIVILAAKVSNFNLMYSNLKLKVATEELAKYVELDKAEAFNFFNILPEYVEEPSGISIETKKEMLTEVYYITEHIERAYNYLKLLLDYLFLLTKGIEGTEVASNIEAAFNHLIELAYNKLNESFNELKKYDFKTESLATDLILCDAEEKQVTTDILFYLDSIKEFKKEIEELKVNPFNDVAKFHFTDCLPLILGLKEPIEDLETFVKSLETKEEIESYNYILESYTSTIPKYNFNTFEIIPPKEIEVNPEEPEITVPEGFIENEIEYLKNLPEQLKEKYNITDEFIKDREKQLQELKNSSEENVPEVDPTEKVVAEDSSENTVPTNEG